MNDTRYAVGRQIRYVLLRRWSSPAAAWYAV